MDKENHKSKPTNDKKINLKEYTKKATKLKREADKRRISTYYGGRNIGD